MEALEEEVSATNLYYKFIHYNGICKQPC